MKLSVPPMDSRKQSALSLLPLLGNGMSRASAIRAFVKVAADFGFEHCLCMGYSTLTTKCSRLYFSNWPKDWIRTYRREYFLKDDPLMAVTRHDISPVMWSKGAPNPSIPNHHRVAEAAATFGWECVYAIPRHGPMGYVGVVGLSAKTTPSLDDADVTVFQSLAIQLHDLCRKRDAEMNAPKMNGKLSAREIECMHWVAQGKTDFEIGKILGVSAATAHFHIEQAKKKLGVHSRTEAAALLVFEGLLT